MSLTNFPYGATSFGVPILGGMFPFTGKYIFVKPYSGLDGNDGLSLDSPIKTLSKALALATANKNDVVLLIAESNTAANTFDMMTVALDWNKDGVHLFGICAEDFIGQRAGLRMATTTTTVTDMFTVSANNCLMANIQIFQGDYTLASGSPRALVVSGMRNKFVNCQISGAGDTGGSMDVAGARSLAVTGAENLFRHCYIGLNTVIRGTMTTEVYLTTGARNIFEDCMIDSYTSLSTFKAVTVGTSDRFVLFKNCMFNAVQNITSAVAPTGAIASGSVNGSVLLFNTGAFGYADVTTADDAKTLQLSMSGLAANVVDQGVAKATDVAP